MAPLRLSPRKMENTNFYTEKKTMLQNIKICAPDHALLPLGSRVGAQRAACGANTATTSTTSTAAAAVVAGVVAAHLASCNIFIMHKNKMKSMMENIK